MRIYLFSICRGIHITLMAAILFPNPLGKMLCSEFTLCMVSHSRFEPAISKLDPKIVTQWLRVAEVFFDIPAPLQNIQTQEPLRMSVPHSL